MQNKDGTYVWELYAYDPYRRPTSTKVKSPYFYEYAFHHDGVVMAKFQNRDQPPELLRKHSDFGNARSHFEIKFHPYINNQYVNSIMCESEGSPILPIVWKSNQFTLPLMMQESECYALNNF